MEGRLAPENLSALELQGKSHIRIGLRIGDYLCGLKQLVERPENSLLEDQWLVASAEDPVGVSRLRRVEHRYGTPTSGDHKHEDQGRRRTSILPTTDVVVYLTGYASLPFST